MLGTTLDRYWTVYANLGAQFKCEWKTTNAAFWTEAAESATSARQGCPLPQMSKSELEAVELTLLLLTNGNEITRSNTVLVSLKPLPSITGVDPLYTPTSYE